MLASAGVSMALIWHRVSKSLLGNQSVFAPIFCIMALCKIQYKSLNFVFFIVKPLFCSIFARIVAGLGLYEFGVK